LVETVFTEEDKKNLKVIAEELPKLRSLVEDLMETLEILGDERLMKSIKASLKDLQENKVLSYKEMLYELGINEKEL
jgi:nitrogen-specific signal transduction histidine kinase